MPGFHVHTEALRTEAGFWDDRRDVMTDIVRMVEELQFTFTHRLYVDDFEPAYKAFRQKIMDRCSAGAEQMAGADGISEALRWIAERYEFVDRREEARLLGLLNKLEDVGKGQ
jgi:hypothetical protein